VLAVETSFLPAEVMMTAAISFENSSPSNDGGPFRRSSGIARLALGEERIESPRICRELLNIVGA